MNLATACDKNKKKIEHFKCIKQFLIYLNFHYNYQYKEKKNENDTNYKKKKNVFNQFESKQENFYKYDLIKHTNYIIFKANIYPVFIYYYTHSMHYSESYLIQDTSLLPTKN